MPDILTADRQVILDGLAERWKPNELRDLAASLLRLADSVDQDWNDQSDRPIFQWPNALSRVERNSLNLALKAQVIYKQRRKRKEFIPSEFLAEPAWDMLLELFMQFAGKAKVSTTSLCIASDSAPSTALRYIGQLESADFIKRSASVFDKRVTFVELTDQGVLAVGRYLEQY